MVDRRGVIGIAKLEEAIFTSALCQAKPSNFIVVGALELFLEFVTKESIREVSIFVFSTRFAS